MITICWLLLALGLVLTMADQAQHLLQVRTKLKTRTNLRLATQRPYTNGHLSSRKLPEWLNESSWQQE